jgi:hypothetical protein
MARSGGASSEWNLRIESGSGRRSSRWCRARESRPCVTGRVKGIVCSVKVELGIGDRTAPVTLGWHYANEAAAPRLVTAYITL